MRASQFTGGFGGNRGTSVLNPSQGADPFENSTPAPKPGNAGRAGITFSGAIAAALPRASNVDAGFNSINLTGQGQEVFKRRGERAANQDVDAFNEQATAANAAATAAKQTEIKKYDTDLTTYNSTVSSLNTTRTQVDYTNSLADQVNAAATIYRNTNTAGAKSSYETLLGQYNAAKANVVGNPALKSVNNLFDNGGKQIQYDNTAAWGWKQTLGQPTRDNLGYNSYDFGNGVSGNLGGTQLLYGEYQFQNNERAQAYRNAGGPGWVSGSIYGGTPRASDLVGYISSPAYNPWSGEVFDRYGYTYGNGIVGKEAANVPYAFGQYNNSADQYSAWYKPPTAPTGTRPNPFVEQQQMQERLPDVVDRRLASNQREIVGGDLPPQVAKTSGDTFAELEVPYREASSLNAAEQQRLGAPKAYRVNSGFVAQAGNNQSYGGQVFTPDQITNQNSTHYYIPVLGWTPKTSLTPLY
jgi:hypothetical protein